MIILKFILKVLKFILLPVFWISVFLAFLAIIPDMILKELDKEKKNVY